MDSLRFACLPGCTSCCREQGFVYLTENDLRRAARLLRTTAAAFEKTYVYRTRHLLRLRKPRRRQCPFLVEEGCGIHAAKPTQCRAFPFWPEAMASRAAWSETAACCPGIGASTPVSLSAALRIAAEMREAYAGAYGDRRRTGRVIRRTAPAASGATAGRPPR